MTSYRKITVEEAESVALSAFMHLAQDDERLTRFLDMTGLRPETVRAAAATPGFFAAVLDHVAADERLLVELARALDTEPERIMEARHTLSPSEFE
jgi:hypothetical protein